MQYVVRMTKLVRSFLVQDGQKGIWGLGGGGTSEGGGGGRGSKKRINPNADDPIDPGINHCEAQTRDAVVAQTGTFVKNTVSVCRKFNKCLSEIQSKRGQFNGPSGNELLQTRSS